MQTNNFIRYKIDSDNTSKRLLICLCVDTSPSMDRFANPIPESIKAKAERVNVDGGIYGQVDYDAPTVMDEVNKAISKFYNFISADEDARYSCEIMTMSFNNSLVNDSDYVRDYFSSVDDKIRNNIGFEVVDNSKTHMSRALNAAIDLLDERQNELHNECIKCHSKSWIIFFTDGRASDDVNQVQDRLKELEMRKKIRVCPIGMKSDYNFLEGFSIHRPISCNKVEELIDIFEKLAQSVSMCSRGIDPGDDIF